MFVYVLGYASVYEPADDTFLLCDALHLEGQDLLELEPYHCIEIG